MDYFCYISRTKVDQLLENIETTQTDAWKESQGTENIASGTLSAGLSIAGIVNLFKGEASYGRKGVIQVEKQVKRHYLEKLKKVLETLCVEPGISEFPSNIDSNTKFEHRYYHYTGNFTGEDISRNQSTNTVTICSSIDPSITLFLDCSLRFFSDSNTPDGEFQIHSANARFFTGDIPLHFETVFLYLHHDDARILGTPLFLKLHDRHGNLFV